MLERDREWPDRPCFSAVQFYEEEMASVRRGKWMYVYDYENESGQLRSASERNACPRRDHRRDHPDTAAELHGTLMDEWKRFVQVTLAHDRASLEELTPAQREDLESMGYL